MNVIWYVRAGDYIAAHHALIFEKWLGRLRETVGGRPWT